jgi:catechol 2,3-dioxygenase-like lactoylglutathione lyase family enzyme
MKNLSLFSMLTVLLAACAASSTPITAPQKSIQTEEPFMQLGNFSVSLAVEDIAVSRAFYEKLGFTIKGGDQEQNWLVMRNGSTVIGLFQGMFEGNILTFNPGWDNDANQLPEFTDVRDLQRTLKAQGIALISEADEASTGPASFVLEDPDGNQILVDQHVPALD